MVAVVDPVTLASACTFVLFSVYGIALGLYGFVRTGLLAFFLLIAASVIGLGVSITNVALVYDSYIGIRVLGHSDWKIFYYTFVCIQPIGSLLTAIAMTILTVWITHRSNQFWSQPLTVAMRTFKLMKTFSEFAALAAASGGSALSR